MKALGQGQDYINFTLRNRIYIDKTEQIFNLLKNDRVFISRPRRFGKSLMLDTIGTLFQRGVDPYFENTWIYDKWNEQKYLVLRIDFLGMSFTDFKEFCIDFDNQIVKFAKINKLKYESKDSPKRSMESLFLTLEQKELEDENQQEVQIVILIDEYDAQLTANIYNSELYETFRTSLRELYGVFKGSKYVRFLGITGVTRLKDISILSVGSEIKDLSYYSPISTIVGFTRDEIRKYYIDYINLAVSLDQKIPEEQITEEQRNELLDNLAEEYYGYCFDDEYKNKVYSTWSVNSFFSDVADRKNVFYGDYWYDNGGIPSVLSNYLDKHIINFEDYEEDVRVLKKDFWDPTSLLDMKQEVLMCQAGYFTVHSKLRGNKSVALGFPNKEVHRALVTLLAYKLFPTANFDLYEINDIFSKSSVDEIVNELNKLMNSISYEEYQNISERTIQGFIHAYMLGVGQNIITEKHSALGRSDIVVEYDNRRLVFELKYAETESECEKKLQEAIKQIKDQRYGEVLPSKEILKIALVFNGDKAVRKFSHYEVVE